MLDLHGERLGAALIDRVMPEQMLVVPSGERYKTLAEAERVLQSLARSGMERADTLLVFGGGVVGDVAGFCAAVYQRGVAFVQIPTTLVAQVDSAYGGKTGVDLPEAKNYVGAFHQPSAVLTDPTLLETLPVEELRAGFAEVIKTGLIAGGDLWAQVGGLDEIGSTVKNDPASIESGDRRLPSHQARRRGEGRARCGPRASLNLGHTVAHGIEAAGAYGAYRHGEAVGLGLLVALRLSERDAGLDPSVRRPRSSSSCSATACPRRLAGSRPTRSSLMPRSTRSEGAGDTGSCCSSLLARSSPTTGSRRTPGGGDRGDQGRGGEVLMRGNA